LSNTVFTACRAFLKQHWRPLLTSLTISDKGAIVQWRLKDIFATRKSEVLQSYLQEGWRDTHRYSSSHSENILAISTGCLTHRFVGWTFCNKCLAMYGVLRSAEILINYLKQPAKYRSQIYAPVRPKTFICVFLFFFFSLISSHDVLCTRVNIIKFPFKSNCLPCCENANTFG